MIVHDGEDRLGKATEAAREALSKIRGIDRSSRIWFQIEEEVWHLIDEWPKKNRKPTDDLERALEEARLAKKEIAASKERIRAAQMAVIEGNLRKGWNKPTDPTKVYLYAHDERTGLPVRITLPTEWVENLSPPERDRHLTRPALKE